MNDLTALRQQCVDFGIGQEDVEAALGFAVAINTVDRALFRDNQAKISVCGERHRLGAMVAYHVADDNDVEQYVIYSPGLIDMLSNHIAARKIEMSAILGYPLDVAEGIIFAIACHEARHRVQALRLGVKLFENEKQSSRDWLLDRILRVLWSYFKYKRQQLREAQSKRELIEFATGDREFDGQVIELLCLAHFKMDMPQEKVPEFVREVALTECRQ